MRALYRSLGFTIVLCSNAQAAPDCARNPVSVKGFKGFQAADGSVIGWGGNSVNVDGMANAYHRNGRPAGAVTTICNAGTAYTPDGKVHQGKDNNCHEMYAVYTALLAAKNWKKSDVGAINWYGVLGKGNTVVAGNTVENYQPVEIAGSGGFYVSPTALGDTKYEDDDQRRYVDAEVIPYGTISKGALSLKIEQGQFGVAYRPDTGKIVPFIVADSGPRVGEGSYALGRELAALPVEKATQYNVYKANVDSGVVWVLFGPKQGMGSPPYTPESVRKASQAAFQKWGGNERLMACIPPR